MTRRVFKNAPELINPLNVAAEDLQTLVSEVGSLASVDASIAAKTIRYVVDDTDDDVLSTLGTLKEAALHIRLFGLQEGARGFVRSGFWHAMNNDVEERVRHLNWLRDLPPGVVMRLAEVCELIGRAAGRTRQPATSWPAWLELLIEELLMAHWHGERCDTTPPMTWSIGTFEDILATADLPADLFARFILTDPNQPSAHSMVYLSHHAARVISGWPAYLAKHTAFVHHTLQRPNIHLRIHGLKQLRLLNYDFAPVAKAIATLCTGPSKSLRQAALPALELCRDAARPHLESILSEGTGAERYEAVAVLWRLFGDEVRDLLQQHAAQEPVARIREDVHRRLTEAAMPPSHASLTLPPRVDVATGIVELNPEVIEACREFFEHAYQTYLIWYEQASQYFEQMPRSYRLRKFATPRRISEEAFDAFIRFVEGKMIDFGTIHNLCQDYYPYLSFGDWQPAPGMALIHVLRVAYAFGQISSRKAGVIWLNRLPQIDVYRRQCATPFGLRELNTALTTLPGIEADTLAKSYLSLDFYWECCFDWEPEAIWPLFAEQEEVLFAALDPATPPDPMSHYDDRGAQRRSAFRVLAMFPQIPPALMPLVWELALGEGKIDRPLAQEAMHSVPNALKIPKIIDALGAGKQAVREAAAAWLGKLGDASAIEPLKQAFHKEKQEIVKGVIMTSLDALGADVNAFLDRDALLIEARQGLKKKRPKGSEWMPLDNLPTLHWQDRGEVVATEVVQWWVIQSIQQKTPVCSPLLRRYLAMCHPSEAAALAQFVLAAWIAQDTLPMPYDEAAKKAQQETDQSWSAYGNQPWFADQYGGVKDNLYRKLLQHYTTDCMGSAIGQKGLLAIASAAGDRECVKLCEQYIRQWFGHRLAQCKCLVEVLAWIEHPAAMQVLFSLANRFRTKAIRQVAEAHVQALAERQGWTRDELADRTIPDAGFERPCDEDGVPIGEAAVLGLDYGARQFHVSLNDQLQPVITREDGKVVKSLPAPGKKDDPEKAKAAKKAFTGAKKTMKEVVKLQTERLYEALCTQRTWAMEDWQRYLATHPIVGALCTRLVWVAFAPDADRKATPYQSCLVVSGR